VIKWKKHCRARALRCGSSAPVEGCQHTELWIGSQAIRLKTLFAISTKIDKWFGQIVPHVDKIDRHICDICQASRKCATSGTRGRNSGTGANVEIVVRGHFSFLGLRLDSVWEPRHTHFFIDSNSYLQSGK